MKKHTLQKTVFLLLMLLSATLIFAQAGALDNTFGTGGKMTFAGGGFGDYKIATQSDGKIILAGQRMYQGKWKLEIVRVNQSGSIDNLFGSGGISTVVFQEDDDVSYNIKDLIVLDDNKILVSGNYSGLSKNCFISKFNENGDLDNSFGTGGKFEVDKPAFASILGTDTNLRGGNITIDKNGDVFLVANRANTCAISFYYHDCDESLFFKITSSGVVDTVFEFLDGLSFPMRIHIEDISRLNDSIQIFVSKDVIDYDYPFDSIETLLRATNEKGLSRGQLSYLHNNEDLPQHLYSSSTFYENDALLAIKNNQIFLAGNNKTSGGVNRFFVAKFHLIGALITPDSTFGTNGAVMINVAPNGESTLTSMKIQDDGKIILGASSKENVLNSKNLTLVRLNNDGTLDNNFGTGGIVRTDVGADNSGYSLFVDIDFHGNKILASAGIPISLFSSETAVARYNNDSSTDIEGLTGFNNSIKVYPNPSHSAININITQPFDNAAYRLTDIHGRETLSGYMKPTNTSIDVSALSNGIYFLTVVADGFSQTMKLLKE